MVRFFAREYRTLLHPRHPKVHCQSSSGFSSIPFRPSGLQSWVGIRFWRSHECLLPTLSRSLHCTTPSFAYHPQKQLALSVGREYPLPRCVSITSSSSSCSKSSYHHVSFAQYTYGLYLGCNGEHGTISFEWHDHESWIIALPFIVRSELLLAPLLPLLTAYFASLLGFNVARHVLPAYFRVAWALGYTFSDAGPLSMR